MRISAFVTIILVSSQALFCQEFRSTATITSASQPVTIDLSNVQDVRGASITIHNSSSSIVSLPQISAPNDLMPINGAAILKQLNGLPPVSTDQERAIQAWQFMLDHSFSFCLSGAKGDLGGWTRDPIEILNSFGFGCCDQLAQTLAWMWQLEGYQARVVTFPFHTVPEIFYDNSWHMLDPDHRIYYAKDDGTIASVAEILVDPTLISRASDANGRDPIGFLASDMAQAYAENGPDVQYLAPFYAVNGSSQMALRPHESLTLHSENIQDTVQFYADGVYLAPSAVHSAEFRWDLSFGDTLWKRYPYRLSLVDVAADSSGAKVLTNTTAMPGYVTYQETSMFPVFGLTLSAQLGGSSSGGLKAYFSNDGVRWSTAVPFQLATGASSFDLSADLSTFANGQYSYFVKIELQGNVQLHRLRVSPIIQTSASIFPTLSPGTPNQLLYQDSSPLTQSRSLRITTSMRSGKPLIRGLHAQSLVTESPAYGLARDYGAQNLVDGDPDSLSYPGSTHLDYLIQLNGSYNVTDVSIDWGYFGSESRYVQSWKILGRVGNGSWQQLNAGGFPGQESMDVPVNATATELRLVADSSNWIGAYDLRVFGNAAPPAIPDSKLGVASNIPEDPIYSLANNYGAANLIDGDSQTLAYPAAKNVDYQISFATPTHLSSATITWGYFGTNPMYVQSWSLLGRNGAGQEWTTLAQGGFPNSTSTQASLDFMPTDLRIVASSDVNWIGIYELSLNGGQPLTGVTMSSNVNEQTAMPSFGAASNLDDGDDQTVAYPGNDSIDYALDPGQTTYFDALKVVWGPFGTSSSYIQSWRVLGLTSDGSWDVIARGGFPNAAEAVIPVQNRYRKLRIAADGANWLGIYEVQALGSTVPAAGQFTVKSNVAEDPVYSLARNYQASNLIDGDPTTLAYPASPHLDYQVSLGQATQLSSAFINWGAFGKDPAYVSSWSLLARNGADQPWVTLSTGGFPNSATILLNLDFAATDVRIVADSVNWIGIYELQIRGLPLQ
jgi:hypothetical protein